MSTCFVDGVTDVGVGGDADVDVGNGVGPRPSIDAAVVVVVVGRRLTAVGVGDADGRAGGGANGGAGTVRPYVPGCGAGGGRLADGVGDADGVPGLFSWFRSAVYYLPVVLACGLSARGLRLRFCSWSSPGFLLAVFTCVFFAWVSPVDFDRDNTSSAVVVFSLSCIHDLTSLNSFSEKRLGVSDQPDIYGQFVRSRTQT